MHPLYQVSPEYRRVVDELHRLTQAYGALAAAYGNAVSDQRRIVAELKRIGGTWDDDPGQGGSSGVGLSHFDIV